MPTTMSRVTKGLTPRRRENLAKLATYLEGLSKRYEHFSMRVFAANFTDVVEYGLKNGGVEKYGCGTIACAVGHGPAAGILVTPSHLEGKDDIDWFSYTAANFLGAWKPFEFEDHIYSQPHLFAWLFGEAWADVDNHHHGAAARIRYLLAGNDLPEDLLKHDNGDADCWEPKPRHRKLYKEFRK